MGCESMYEGRLMKDFSVKGKVWERDVERGNGYR